MGFPRVPASLLGVLAGATLLSALASSPLLFGSFWRSKARDAYEGSSGGQGMVRGRVATHGDAGGEGEADVFLDRSPEETWNTSFVYYFRPPKTGSSTLWGHMRELSWDLNFTHVVKNICPHCKAPLLSQVDSLVHDMHVQAAKGNIWFTSHAHFLPFDTLPKGTVSVSMVRNPIARKKSEYTYFWPRFRENATPDELRCLCDDSMSFDSCILSTPSGCEEKILHLGHTYIQYFCGYQEVCLESPGSDDALNMALQNMRSSFVGLTEHLVDFVNVLGLYLPGYFPKHAVKPVETIKVSDNSTQLSRAALEKVLEYNKNNNELVLYKAIYLRWWKLKTRYLDVDSKDFSNEAKLALREWMLQ